MDDLTKPWTARQATGGGRVDWVVMGYCPYRHEQELDDDGRSVPFQCAPDCPACNCRHCEGVGRHLLVEGLTEDEARRVADFATWSEVEQFLLGLGDRFVWWPHSITLALKQGVERRVVSNSDSVDYFTVFPSHAKHRQREAV